MNTNEIIIEIDAQISRLLEAKVLLASPEITIKRDPGRPSRANLSDNGTSFIPAKSPARPIAKRVVSVEARAKMAAAQKARWAKKKRAVKRAARIVATAPAAKRAAPDGAVSETAHAKKTVSAKKVDRAKTEAPVTPAS
jgi:hypothetical protein